MPVRRLPLSHYVDLLERRVPFTYLSYGDGEFHAMSGLHNGQKFTQYEEVVTPEIAAEMRASLDVSGDDIIRGTDEFIVEPETYGGNDKPVIFEANRVAKMSIGERKIDWVDGTVWDEAVKNGELGPFLRVLRERKGRQFVGCIKCWVPWGSVFCTTPDVNAVGSLDDIERWCLRSQFIDIFPEPVFVLCMGLGALPLALRIRGKIPGATVIDLGSALDVFAGLGADRGWRKELYADPAEHQELIRKNLEGV